MYAGHVKCVKFLMPPQDYEVNGNTLVYRLLLEAYRGIMIVIDALGPK